MNYPDADVGRLDAALLGRRQQQGIFHSQPSIFTGKDSVIETSSVIRMFGATTAPTYPISAMGKLCSWSRANGLPAGYGLTKNGASNAAVRDAALKFMNYFYSEPETTQRLRDGAIVVPILKDYKVPDDLPAIVKQKVYLAQTAMSTDVIDAFLSGDPNAELNAGMQKIVTGSATAEEVAEQVETLLRK